MRFHHLPAPILCDGVTCAQVANRMTDVANQIAAVGTARRYLAIGDSLTEGARLPLLCGRTGINAGIAGATTETFLHRAKGLAAAARPDFVVVGLGTNDALRGNDDDFRKRLEAIVASLSGYRVLLLPASDGAAVPGATDINAIIADVGVTEARPVPPDNRFYVDGVHFSPAGQAFWERSLGEAAAAALGEGQTCLGR